MILSRYADYKRDISKAGPNTLRKEKRVVQGSRTGVVEMKRCDLAEPKSMSSLL